MWVWIVFGVLIIAGIWVSFIFLPVPLWVAILVTAVVVLSIVGVIVFRRIRAIRRAAALERELMAQAAGQAEAARPDRRPEILALQAQMKEAIGALKRTKLARAGGKAALYALPWYVIAGPPAAGKTTALEQSGLKFSSAGSGRPKIRGTAGTRNCDWWFSQEAILLDTAGRFTTEDDDQPEWLAFLDTIRRFRPEKPLDGLVVAISVTDLAGANEVQTEEIANKVRARVDEVMDRLGVALPVYVMFTKADLIAGFIEFWGDLTKQQRGQAWGAAFGLDDERLDEPGRAFEAEFDLLVTSLHRRVLDRLPRERAPEVRAKILQFPVEFRALRLPLAHFIDEFCRHDAYREAPLFRGFYFSSGTQVGRPIDRVLSNMLRGFELPPTAGGERAPAAESQSYFVTDVFRSVIFPDRNAAMSTERSARRRARRHAITVAAGLLITLGIVVPAVASYLDNSDLVDTTVEAVTGSPKSRPGTPVAAKVSLDKLLGQVESLETKKDQWKIPGFIGPRAAPPLYDPVRAAYVKRVRAMIDGPVREQATADLGSVANLVRADASTFEAAYNDVKLYAMMTSPAHLDVEWATPRLTEKWERALRSATGETRLKEHVHHYLEGLAADPSWAWRADDVRLSRARARLARQPFEELQYAWLIGHARGTPAIGPEQAFYGASARYATVRENVEVPGHYTKPGWEKIRSALDQPGADIITLEPWVLGDVAKKQAEDDEKADMSRLQDLYFSRYEKAWTDFFAGISVRPPTDLETAIEELRALDEADGPYTRLFQLLRDNAMLDMGSLSLGGKLLERGKAAAGAALNKLVGRDAGTEERKISPVERHFRSLIRFGFGDVGREGGAPTGLSQYLAQLSTLEVSLGQLAESKTAPTTQFEGELERTKSAVTRLFSGFDQQTRLLLEPLLMNPIRGSQQGVVTQSYGFLSDKWKAEVWSLWNEKLAQRYPFAESKDAALADFAEFFRPQTGTLWKFVAQNLQERLERRGNTYSPKAGADPIAFRRDFLGCLNVAQEISDAVFGTGQELAVPFAVKLEPTGVDIAKTTFQVGNQPFTYRNEPEHWVTMQWPAKEGGDKGAFLRVEGKVNGNDFNEQVPRGGDFGLFRLLESGNVKPLPGGDGTTLLATYTLGPGGQPPVRIQLKPAKSVNPFTRDFFRRLKCPPDVTGLGAGPRANVNAAANEPDR